MSKAAVIISVNPMVPLAMMNWDENIRLVFLQPGRWTNCPDGFIHQKTVPYSIVAQAIAGEYEVTSGGQTVRVAAPQAFLTAAHQPMRIIHHAHRARGFSARWVHFTFMLFETIDIGSLLKMPLKVEAEAGAELGQIIGELLDPPQCAAGQLQAAARRQELSWRLLRIICEISRPRPEALQRLHGCRRLLPVLAHMRHHLAEPVGIAKMADLAGLSVSRFFACFRQHLGSSPDAYLKRLRLNEAAYCLSSGEDPLKQIAARVGFANAFHLSREFKRQFGLSPARFRVLGDGRAQVKDEPPPDANR